MSDPILDFGFLANRCRAVRLAAINAAPSPAVENPATFDGYPCPVCRLGRLRVTAGLVPNRFDGG